MNQLSIEITLLNIYTRESCRTLSAIVYGHKESIEIKVIPKGSLTFENQPVQGAEQRFTYRYDDEVIEELVDIKYFTLNSLSFYGLIKPLGEYSVATQTEVIPKIASIDYSRQFINERICTDSSKKIPVNFHSLTWSLLRASASTAWLCIDIEIYENSSECYQIDTYGDISQSKKTLQYLVENINLHQISELYPSANTILSLHLLLLNHLYIHTPHLQTLANS
ncbi:hypothetical protein [Psychrobacter sp. NG27]|uniref:hypothetical protein n=1 Tax=Psychrobacter sp. NG27 TaxID=2781966 RepID=UPI0018DF78D5|nr:hypothetical protein [Psychrobacter sp. NG27]MBI0427297.1 hypothetical protein [Psychrobacter sp. NG27]